MAPHLSKIARFRLAVYLTCFAPLLVLVAVLRTILNVSKHQLPLRPYLICAFLNLIMRKLDALELQHLLRSTRETYTGWLCHKLKAQGTNNRDGRLSYDVEPITDGDCSILWVGNRHNAKKVVLFFHGGGYVAPMLPGHLEWCWRAYVTAGIETYTEVAIAVLEYTLYPAAKYPVQLRQAASGLSHLLASGFQPQNIIIAGDSAGGGLVAQILCHLIRPYPGVKEITLKEPLAGSILVSPWLTKHTNDQSFAENGSIDMLSAETVDKFTSDLFQHANKEGDHPHLAFPLDQEFPCFDGLSKCTKHMLVTVGYHEVFRDQCTMYVNKVRRLEEDIELLFVVQPKMAHDFILLEGTMKQSGECTKAMKEWMISLLADSSVKR